MTPRSPTVSDPSECILRALSRLPQRSTTPFPRSPNSLPRVFLHALLMLSNQSFSFFNGMILKFEGCDYLASRSSSIYAQINAKCIGRSTLLFPYVIFGHSNPTKHMKQIRLLKFATRRVVLRRRCAVLLMSTKASTGLNTTNPEDCLWNLSSTTCNPSLETTTLVVQESRPCTMTTRS